MEAAKKRDKLKKRELEKIEQRKRLNKLKEQVHVPVVCSCDVLANKYVGHFF